MPLARRLLNPGRRPGLAGAYPFSYAFLVRCPFYCLREGVMWVLHGCKKQDQLAGIAVARQRMKRVG